jgi:thymidylate synthase (FAD)
MSIPHGAIPVLDKGYVLLTRFPCDVHYSEEGIASLTPCSELGVVADARVSTARAAEEFGAAEARTLGFLLREGHTSPFRGQVIQLEVKAPLFVARQWHRYVVGHEHDESMTPDPFLAWNETSRRYVETEPEFYIPDVWRTAPERRSQGSGGEHQFSSDFVDEFEVSIQANVERYQWALKCGVCAEQARLFLPAYAMYTTWRWTCSLQGLCHFLSQRLAHDAQSEIRQYAEAVKRITLPHWAQTIEMMGAPKK